MSIQLSNLSFSYPSSPQKRILTIDNWSIEANKKHFIYGPSGSGKSTLLNIISGLLLPVAGSVSVLGEQLEKMSSRQRDRFRANNIGYVFQRFNLIHYLSAIDNIKLAHHFSNRKQSQLNQKITTLLTALNISSEDWQRPVNQLSIGQQQRIGIARAFINQPKVLIADEPTSSLDFAAKERFMSLLTTLCQEHQTTLLFVSHDTGLKHHFDTVQSLDAINYCPNNGTAGSH